MQHGSGPAHGEVWLFKDGKFGGHCWKFHESQPDFTDLGCNDKVSSLRVGPGTTVILFNDKKYGGGSIELNCDASSLGKFNDKSSSMKILKEAPQHHEPGPGECFVYRDSNFESYVWRLKESCPDVAKLGAKGAISSLKVGPGTEVVLYKETNYKGSTTTCGRHMSGLGDFNDKTASIKIFKSA